MYCSVSFKQVTGDHNRLAGTMQLHTIGQQPRRDNHLRNVIKLEPRVVRYVSEGLQELCIRDARGLGLPHQMVNVRNAVAAQRAVLVIDLGGKEG